MREGESGECEGERARSRACERREANAEVEDEGSENERRAGTTNGREVEIMIQYNNTKMIDCTQHRSSFQVLLNYRFYQAYNNFWYTFNEMLHIRMLWRIPTFHTLLWPVFSAFVG